MSPAKRIERHGRLIALSLVVVLVSQGAAGLRENLMSDDAGVRAGAITKLLRIREADGTDERFQNAMLYLAASLYDGSAAYPAARAFAEIGPEAAEYLESVLSGGMLELTSRFPVSIVKMLERRPAGIWQGTVVDAFIRAGPPAVPLLLKTDGDFRRGGYSHSGEYLPGGTRAIYEGIYRGMGMSAVPVLEVELAREDWGAAAAAYALGFVGRAHDGAIVRLRQLLQHSSETVRLNAVVALGVVGSSAAAAVPEIIRVVEGRYYEEKVWPILLAIGSDEAKQYVAHRKQQENTSKDREAADIETELVSTMAELRVRKAKADQMKGLADRTLDEALARQAKRYVEEEVAPVAIRAEGLSGKYVSLRGSRALQELAQKQGFLDMLRGNQGP